MRSAFGWILVPLAAVCFLSEFGRDASASTMEFVSLEAMCETSDGIVQGEVVRAVAGYEANGQIWTTYTIAVTEVLKSQTGGAESKVVVKQIGGTVGDVTLMAPLVPHFMPGAEVLVFTKDYGAGWQSVTNGPQGCLRIEQVATTDALGRQVQRERARELPDLYLDYEESDLGAFKEDVRTILDVQARSARQGGDR